jgi:nitroreductase
MDIERLLTTTRSARKSLDLDAHVDIDDIRECLRVGLQAANGSNQQSWRWLVVTDAGLREQLAGLYRDAYLLRVGGQMLGDLIPAGSPEGRLMSSTEWLVENMAKVPVLVIPCYQPYLPRIDGDESFYQLPCTARSSRRYGTFNWRCMPAATALASRRCICITRTPLQSCCRSRKATRKAVCFPSVASARVIPSGRLAGAPWTRSSPSTAGTARRSDAEINRVGMRRSSWAA